MGLLGPHAELHGRRDTQPVQQHRRETHPNTPTPYVPLETRPTRDRRLSGPVWRGMQSYMAAGTLSQFSNTVVKRTRTPIHRTFVGNESVPIQLAQCWFPLSV